MKNIYKLNNLLMLLSDKVYWKDRDGNYLGCNKAMAKMAGLNSPAKIVGKSDFDLPWRDQAKSLLKKDKKTLQLGIENTVEETFISQNKRKIIFLTTRQPLRNKANKIVGILCTAKEIKKTRLSQSEVKLLQMQDALHTKSAFYNFENVIAHLPGYVYWKDSKGIYQGCNDNLVKAAGLSSGTEVVGKTDYDIAKILGWPRETAKSFRNIDMEVMRSKIPKLSIEEPPFVIAGGGTIYLLSSKVPLYDSGHNVVGIVGISVDITERKLMEEDLRAAKETAEEANRAKTIFLANMSHDIKTPLAGIISTAENITLSAKDPEYKASAANISESGLRLLDLMNELIELSRIDAGIVTNKEIKFNLRSLIDDIALLMKPTLIHRSLKLERRYDGNIPNILVGNRSYVFRILLNLVANAIKFTKKGKISISAKMAKTDESNVAIKLIVQDTGIGIPKDKQQAIFERFTRLTHSYEGIYKGSGLGLYMVKQFIDEMKGEIRVDSEPGKGSKFICLIPLKFSEQADNKANADNEDSGENAAKVNFLYQVMRPEDKLELMPVNSANLDAQTKHKVLLVEDNVIAAKAAYNTLLSLNIIADIASTGAEAISKFSPNKYSLIFMDIGLPDTHGFEVSKAIRRIEENTTNRTPIIALSAHIDASMKSDCLACGMDDAFAKPLIKEKAKQMIAQWMVTNNKVTSAKKKELRSIKSAVSNKQKLKIIDLELGVTLTDGSIDDVKESLTLFMQMLPESQKELQEAYRTKDNKNLLNIVHKIHGGLSYCGLPRLKKAVQALETTLREDSKSKQIAELYHKVCLEIDALISAYHKVF